MDKVVTCAAADTEHWADTGDMIRITSWFFSQIILFWLFQKLNCSGNHNTHKCTTYNQAMMELQRLLLDDDEEKETKD